jgi:hypothetical protein
VTQTFSLAGKACSKCGERKPLDDFHRDRGGHQSHCKVCKRMAPERKREKDRRLQHTPGTYRYMAAHGIGLPGAITKLGARRRYRNAADKRDRALVDAILAKYPDLSWLADRPSLPTDPPARPARASLE